MKGMMCKAKSFLYAHTKCVHASLHMLQHTETNVLGRQGPRDGIET